MSKQYTFVDNILIISTLRCIVFNKLYFMYQIVKEQSQMKLVITKT